MYRELVEHDIKNRAVIVPISQIAPEHKAHLRYCSLFMFGTDILTHVKTNKNANGDPTVGGFKGNVYSEAIWVDIDAAGKLPEARQSCIDLVVRLNQEYQVNPDHLFVYFSGLKGFHVAIHSKIIGFADSEPVEPDKVKDFVKAITKGLPHVDTAIYEPVRIFRIENSRHEKSGLYKLRISFQELQCDIESITTLAKQPRKFPYPFDFSGLTISEGLNKVWINSGNYQKEQAAYEHTGNLFEPPKEGERNKTLLIQACILFRKSELSSYAILDIISNAAFISNLESKEKIDITELKTLVKNAERLVGNDRKNLKEEEINIKSFGEWIPEWENDILRENTHMSLCFSDFNQVMKGRLKGKLGVIMGYGGSKKSLYALNICLRNMKENKDIAIYSTMEMSVPRLMDRIIDHEVKVYSELINASSEITNIYKRDLAEGRKFMIDQLAKDMGNNMQIVSNSRMKYEQYKKSIQIVKQTTGNPAILVVDGLSMMGGDGTETEVYSRNSADLKRLANEENILILLICHVSKGAEVYTRDLSRQIRGSEKILDNCDFYMTMSQIQELDNPESYMQNLGFINFHDKRGTGQIVNIVYEFNPSRLHLTNSREDPKIYMKPVKNGRKLEKDF